MLDRGETSARNPARVLIVDDHPIVREGLAIRIGRQPDLEVCGEAASIPEALARIDATRPDLALIDISLGDGDGIDLIRRIRARASGILILVCSMYPEELYAERALNAGAMGYISKHEVAGRIIEAIRCILRGRPFLSPEMSARLVLRAVSGTAAAGVVTPLESLSSRELEVFRAIGLGKTTAETADSMKLSIHTIETYRQRIKAKLGLKTSAELARSAAQWVLENG